MQRRNNEMEWRRIKTPQIGLGRSDRCLGSGAGFRRATRAINGLLTSFLRLVRKPQGSVFGAIQEGGAK
jgi:hypothetical protein